MSLVPSGRTVRTGDLELGMVVYSGGRPWKVEEATTAWPVIAATPGMVGVTLTVLTTGEIGTMQYAWWADDRVQLAEES